MIKGNEDITDEEFDNFFVPYNNNFNISSSDDGIPEVFAFQIANSYYRECLIDATLEQHCNSMCDIFNGFRSCINEVKTKTIELLQIKYNLNITNDNPLTLEKWQ